MLQWQQQLYSCSCHAAALQHFSGCFGAAAIAAAVLLQHVCCSSLQPTPAPLPIEGAMEVQQQLFGWCGMARGCAQCAHYFVLPCATMASHGGVLFVGILALCQRLVGCVCRRCRVGLLAEDALLPVASRLSTGRPASPSITGCLLTDRVSSTVLPSAGFGTQAA